MDVNPKDLKNYLEDVKFANACSKRYHVDGVSDISDEEYDRLYRSIVDFETKYPNCVDANSPTQRVGEKTGTKTLKYKHIHPMFSLDNIFTVEELDKFAKRFSCLKKQYGEENTNEYYVDYKLDGLSLELIYIDGRLHRAVTRGDGNVGDCVTLNAAQIANIPTFINYRETCSIRGEVIVYLDDYYRTNIERERQGLKPYATPRSYAVASLMVDDPEITKQRQLKFYAWDMLPGKVAMVKYSDIMTALSSLGFNTPSGKICHGVDEIRSFIVNAEMERKNLTYAIDGVVIKQNHPAIRREIGCNSHAPGWATAWKFRANGNVSTIESIKWNIGKSCKLTPVATLAPITIDGVTYSKATMHNASYVKDNQLGVGGEVEIIRTCDVIPKINRIVSHGAYAGLPTKCPYCGADTVHKGADLYCTSDTCIGVLKARLAFAVSKDCLSIKGIGPEAVDSLIDSKTVTGLLDMFHNIDGSISGVNQQVLDNAVDTFRRITMAQLLTILTIPGVGKASAIKIAAETMTMSNLIDTLDDDNKFKFMGVSNNIKNNLREWLNISDHRKLIEAILALDLPHLGKEDN